MNGSNDAGPQFPAGSRVLKVAFAAAAAAEKGAALFPLPAPLGRVAVAGDDLALLLVPTDGPDDADLLARARDWADAGADAPGQIVTLQGAQIVWARDRAAVLAAADRLDGLAKAVAENHFYETELRAVEGELAGLWPDLEADGPLAFEFNEKSVRGRKRLQERFRRVLALRARLARVTPHVLAPHAYPPTLATQVGERLRERARMPHRVESLDAQLDVFERVYEGCGQRASEFVLARTGHILEWVIIALLLVNTLLAIADLMAGRQ